MLSAEVLCWVGKQRATKSRTHAARPRFHQPPHGPCYIQQAAGMAHPPAVPPPPACLSSGRGHLCSTHLAVPIGVYLRNKERHLAACHVNAQDAQRALQLQAAGRCRAAGAAQHAG